MVQPRPRRAARGAARGAPGRSEGIGRVGPVAPERRREVLHEVDLVDLAGGDGLPRRGDRAGVGGCSQVASHVAAPRPSRLDARARARAPGAGRTVESPASRCGRLPPAGDRLRRSGPGASAAGAGQALPEVDVGAGPGAPRRRPRRSPPSRRCRSMRSKAPSASWTSSTAGARPRRLTRDRGWVRPRGGWKVTMTCHGPRPARR